mmetsp:Transcript_5988/g.7403  ORF Transcript_5988/g.7403 Transcript_5988/m.7403 type:complete len:205 (-) Transcript_5988:159-773(-)
MRLAQEEADRLALEEVEMPALEEVKPPHVNREYLIGRSTLKKVARGRTKRVLLGNVESLSSTHAYIVYEDGSDEYLTFEELESCLDEPIKKMKTPKKSKTQTPKKQTPAKASGSAKKTSIIDLKAQLRAEQGERIEVTLQLSPGKRAQRSPSRSPGKGRSRNSSPAPAETSRSARKATRSRTPVKTCVSATKPTRSSSRRRSVA